MSARPQIMSLALGDIAEGEHLGLIDDGALACLTARLAIEGQRIPVLVRQNGNRAAQPWTLVAGRHRYRSALALGWPALDALQCADEHDGADVIARIQVAENLDRRVLRPIEKAIHLMQRWHETAASIPAFASVTNAQKRRAAQVRWGASASVANADIIDAAVADTSGWGVRSVRRYRTLHAAIVGELPDLFAGLNAHPLGESLSAMERLAKLNPHARQKTAETLLSQPEWPSLDAVMVAAGTAENKGARAADDDFESLVITRWSRMPLRAKKGVGVQIATTAPPTVAAAMIEAFRERGLL